MLECPAFCSVEPGNEIGQDGHALDGSLIGEDGARGQKVSRAACKFRHRRAFACFSRLVVADLPWLPSERSVAFMAGKSVQSLELDGDDVSPKIEVALSDGGTPMAFRFCESMLNDYLTQGYLVLRGIVPPALLRDLRVEADKARDLAHKINGPQTQRIQPLSRYSNELNLKPFQHYLDLPVLRDAITRLLGPGYTTGQLDIMGLLVEPLDHPWTCGWHRDGVVEVPPDAYDEIVRAKLAEVWHNLHYFNQINCAIYAESCTWFVPGSHLRQRDLPGERQTSGDPGLREQGEGLSDVEAERVLLEHCLQFPGAVQMHLHPGDYMIYRNLAWHIGNYLTHQPRATIHDVVRFEPGGSWSGWAETKQESIARYQSRQTTQT